LVPDALTVKPIVSPVRIVVLGLALISPTSRGACGLQATNIAQNAKPIMENIKSRLELVIISSSKFTN
jgi:hypothetical protein